MSNLLDNAIKYGGTGGAVTVTAAHEGGRPLIVIADTGPGIAPEYRERVKERFFRVPGTADRPGTGLGLPLVEAIVAQHRGSMTIGDANPGTRVALSF